MTDTKQEAIELAKKCGFCRDYPKDVPDLFDALDTDIFEFYNEARKPLEELLRQ